MLACASVLALGVLVASSPLGSSSTRKRAVFDAFKATYGREYTAQEDERRFAIFQRNVQLIEELNADLSDHAEYAVGKFADREPHELPRRRRQPQKEDECTDPLKCLWGGAKGKPGPCYVGRRFPAFCNGTLPSHLDWTQLGAVTGVKDQGDCGNCFAFSVTGDLEATWFMAGHALVSLSEQQLTSCDKDGDDGGCGGSATVLDTFTYVQQNGLALESRYPLCSSNKSCTPAAGCCDKEDPECRGKDSCKHQMLNGVCQRPSASSPAINISGYYQVSGGVKHWAKDLPLPIDEGAMMELLVKTGPLSIAVNSERFDNYKRGVMSGKKCKGTQNSLDHEVLLVGFGEEAPDADTGAPGMPYWKIKNSWNTDWGEEGYVRLQRGGTQNPTLNYCGVAADCSTSRP